VIRRVLMVYVSVAALPFALGGCLGVETTPEKSAAIAKTAAKELTSQKGLRIGALNPSITVQGTAVVQDPNGVAAIVRLKNTGATQVRVPIGLTVSDAKGAKLYANDTPGLDPTLTELPLVGAGQEVDWVDNQILTSGKAAKAAARVGKARGKDGAAASAKLPALALAGIESGHDEDGFYAKGTVANHSAVLQKRLVITCVARAGGRVIAAGRAIVDRLPPLAQAKKPTTFTVFFIGDPKSAELGCSAPPTVLSGATQ
jgi:hypothetical protein